MEKSEDNSSRSGTNGRDVFESYLPGDSQFGVNQSLFGRDRQDTNLLDIIPRFSLVQESMIIDQRITDAEPVDTSEDIRENKSQEEVRTEEALKLEQERILREQIEE